MQTLQAAIDSPYLDTLISLVLIYALLSVFVSILLEGWNKRIKERGVFLQRMVYRLLDDPLNLNFGYLIYQHPIINKMRKDGNSYPHYIPAEGFANALIDTLAEQAVVMRYVDGPDGVLVKQADGQDLPLSERLQRGVQRLNDSEFKRLMLNFLDRNTTATSGQEALAPQLDMDKLKKELGRWFDDFMDRATGEYKNGQRGKLRLIGLLVALLLNVDSLHLVRVLLNDRNLRDRMVQRAEAVDQTVSQRKDTTEAGLRKAVLQRLSEMDTTHVKGVRNDSLLLRSLALVLSDNSAAREREQADSLLAVLDQWQLPIGWSCTEAPLSWMGRSWCACDSVRPPPHPDRLLRYFTARNERSLKQFFLWLLGILITGWSLSLGAPFWFETLSKLINIRRSGLKPLTTDERTTK